MRDTLLLAGASVCVLLSGCVGSGTDVPADHPARAGAPSAPLVEVAAMLRSDEPRVSATPPDPHAHHHHHHGGGGAGGTDAAPGGETTGGETPADGEHGGPAEGANAPVESAPDASMGETGPPEGGGPGEADPHGHHHHGGAP